LRSLSFLAALAFLLPFCLLLGFQLCFLDLDAFKEFLGGVLAGDEFGVLLPPAFGQLALEGPLQDALAQGVIPAYD
jgi:hypothetical protein